MKETNDTTLPKGGGERIRRGGTFYKCPVGGFASLRPGVCPKCGATLAPGDAATSERIKEASRKG